MTTIYLSDQQAEALRNDPGVRQIPGFPAYHVSHSGTVYRLQITRSVGGSHRGPHVVAGSIDKAGMRWFRLTTYPKKETHNLTICHLLALAFWGTPPTPDHRAVYRDGNPHHNWSSNVMWLPPRKRKIVVTRAKSDSGGVDAKGIGTT